ncbi:hypothetical protein CAPTEDRAFT_210654 [Capitella teleta]|nr:hypothetical protein CAPTEDRAFT_210654 [Capitella teleta]|eukprot:ELU15590.1 hypothetical protein CAPTEDRAFT_210654 [Capitella teleta]
MNQALVNGVAGSSTREKQGHLGDLSKKSDAELRELLERQESIMKTQRHILINLPDKGAKVQKMIDNLKEILASREVKVDDATDLFERLSISAEAQNRTRITTHDDETLRGVVNTPSDEVTIIEDNRINAYEKVISQQTVKKSSFSTNHTPKAHHVSELPEKTLRSKPALKPPGVPTQSPGRTLQQQPKGEEASNLKYRYDDSLENDIHGARHHKAISIDVREAIQLQLQQKKHLEELQIKEASQKLAERFKVNMSSFNPDGQSLYRNPQDDFEEKDSDDDDDPPADYPE